MVLEASPGDGDGSFYGSPIIPFNTAVISLCILLLSGIIAGIIPTIRALQIKAIDAIREE
jgi:putative ABC transport system permease protein